MVNTVDIFLSVWDAELVVILRERACGFQRKENKFSYKDSCRFVKHKGYVFDAAAGGARTKDVSGGGGGDDGTFDSSIIQSAVCVCLPVSLASAATGDGLGSHVAPASPR